MYRRPKFLEILLQIRREMALEADYDVDLFAEIVRSGVNSSITPPQPLEIKEQSVRTPGHKVKSTNGVLP